MKFRAIVNPTTVIYFTIQDLVQKGYSFSFRELLIPWLAAGNMPDRETGLKDKNGVEIYEGDIIDARSTEYIINGIYEVLFYDGSFCIRHGYIHFNLSNLLYRDNNIDIFGNKYQNPELVNVD